MAYSRRMEPRRVTLQHILIAFKDTGTKATRSKDEARKLADDVLLRARSGENFGKLMKEFSDDSPEGGTYSLSNRGVTRETDEFERDGMVPAFGDVGFKLKPGEIELAPYDPKASPYGWHIIKRLK
jgi:parvulin-like peptidyl-prolyl isomerase